MCTARLHCETDEFASCQFFFAFFFLFIYLLFFHLLFLALPTILCRPFFACVRPFIRWRLFLFLYVLLTVLGPYLYIIVCLSLFRRFVFVCKHVFFWSCALQNRTNSAMRNAMALNPLMTHQFACVLSKRLKNSSK